MNYDSDTIEAIRFLITSHAWKDFFEPMILSARESCIEALLDPSQKRKNDESDDFLRGRVGTLDAILTIGPGVVAEADAGREQAAEAKEAEAEYDTQSGRPRDGR